ncbi:hypothetical protein F5Y04DRAFT_268981 [Hypomontagnella monticulosa]|nr:hypothetical protein F5Y04DRAFT_268981 [Hypomontagnella monticulosa]
MSSSRKAISSEVPNNHVLGLLYHLHTVYLFSRDNIKDIICIGFVFGTLNSLVAPLFSMGPPLSFNRVPFASYKMLLWSWSNLFLFNLHNQRHPSSISEDVLNKPWRPIPAGRITSAQATRLMYLMYPITLLISLEVGGLGPCILEAFCCLWYNEWGGAANPFLKNLLNGLGFAWFLSGPFEVATGHSILAGNDKAVIWVAILTYFRDMDGDRAAGRNTVPLVIGDKVARIVVLLGVAGWTGAACWYWEVSWIESLIPWASGGLMVGNLFYNRSREGDSFSWKLFPAWLLSLFLLPVISGWNGGNMED